MGRREESASPGTSADFVGATIPVTAWVRGGGHGEDRDPAIRVAVHHRSRLSEGTRRDWGVPMQVVKMRVRRMKGPLLRRHTRALVQGHGVRPPGTGSHQIHLTLLA